LSLLDVRSRVVEQARDEPVDLVGFRTRLLEAFAGVADPRRNGVEVAAQREQRRAEIVGDGELARVSIGSPPAIASTCVFSRRSGATSQRLVAQIRMAVPASRAARPAANAASSRRVRSSGVA
jgi:hypothetical protein